jgi:hypothetical protein
MPVADYGRLNTTLSNSRIQVENNALHQTIKGLIDAVKTNQANVDEAVAAINSALEDIRSIELIEVDTRSLPVTYDLSTIKAMAIIKDVYGNASVNNITLTGTVEGVVDPVINTNFGFYKVYVGISDGLLHTW